MTGHEKSRAVVLAALMVLSVFATGIAFTGTAAAEDLDQCRTIDSSGTYNLTDNISVSQESGDCIEITSSNVTFNGNGNEIADTSSQPDENVDDNAAIRVNSGDGSELTNVTVRNVNVEQFNDGVRYDNVNNSTVTDVTAKFNAEGISVTDSSDVEISDNSLEGNKVDNDIGGAGIGLVDSTESEVTGSTLGNDNLGIFVSGSENNTIADNEINETTGSDGIGFYSASQNNTIEDNTVTNAFDNGIILFDGSDNNAILGNDLANNTDDGLNLNDASGNEIRNNTIQDNDRSGLTLNEDDFGDENQAPESGSDDGSNNNLITDNNITGNSRAGIGLAGNNMENLIYDNFLRQADDDTRTDGTENVIFAGGAASTPNQYNVEPREETNIIGGQYTAGNYYANPGDAQGYSEQCADDSERFGICDESNDLDDDAGTQEDIDQFPITESGEIGEIEISPETVDFGDVETDENATQDVNISNVGNDTITANATGISGDDASAFSIVSEDTNTTLAPGESFEVSVEFAPDDQADDQTANLTVTSNDSTEPSTDVQLTGDGLPAGQGDVDAPFRQQFGSVDIGNSTSETFFLENDGTDPVKVNETTIEGASDSDFEITEGSAGENNTYTIDEGETQAVTIEFAPGSTGDKDAVLTVGTVDDDTETTQLMGTGEAPHTLRINGTSDYTPYWLRAPGQITDTAGITGEDDVSSDSAGGAVGPGSDTYNFTGDPADLQLYVPTGASVFIDGSQVNPDDYESQVSFVGDGDYSSYNFEVKNGQITGSSGISGEDNIDQSDDAASGAVAGGSDSYTFTGSFQGVSIDGGADLTINGQDADLSTFYNTLRFEGQGSLATYDFSVSGEIENTAGVTGEDTVSGDGADGAIKGGSDVYVYSGTLDDLNTDGDVDVSRNSQDVAEDTDFHELQFIGQGDTASYDLSVSDHIVDTDDLTSEDSVTDSSANGAVKGGHDTYYYKGSLDSLNTDGNVVVEDENGDEVSDR